LFAYFELPFILGKRTNFKVN